MIQVGMDKQVVRDHAEATINRIIEGRQHDLDEYVKSSAAELYKKGRRPILRLFCRTFDTYESAEEYVRGGEHLDAHDFTVEIIKARWLKQEKICKKVIKLCDSTTDDIILIDEDTWHWIE